MNVTEHRPPLKRIDLTPKPRTYVDPYAGYDLDRTSEIQEQDRVWKLIRQSAEGCNQVGGEG